MSTSSKPSRQSLPRSFQVAFAGLVYGIRTQRNMQIHLALAMVVGAAALFFNVSKIEWCLLLICIGLMWSVELLNTAVEAVVDHLTPEYHEHARIAKDVAAAGVLMAAIAAAAVGLVIFVPYLQEWAAG